MKFKFKDETDKAIKYCILPRLTPEVDSGFAEILKIESFESNQFNLIQSGNHTENSTV